MFSVLNLTSVCQQNKIEHFSLFRDGFLLLKNSYSLAIQRLTTVVPRGAGAAPYGHTEVIIPWLLSSG